jgi:hypothetical protein
MYARVSNIQIDPSKLTQMKEAMPAAGAKLKQIPGILECMTCWDDSGKGTVFAVYESQAAADAAAESVRSVWGGLMGFLSAPPSVFSSSNVTNLLK